MKNTERQILDSAKVQFMRFGFRKTNLDDIVQDVHISKATIYTYFKNKEDLFMKFAEDEIQSLFDQLTSKIASETDPFQKLVLYVTEKMHYFRTSYEKQGSSISIFKELKETYESIRSGRSRELSILETILEEGQEKGVFRLGQLQQTARLIAITIQSFDARWIWMSPKKAKEEIRILFELMFNGMRA